jgi:hypothetical protein
MQNTDNENANWTKAINFWKEHSMKNNWSNKLADSSWRIKGNEELDT